MRHPRSIRYKSISHSIRYEIPLVSFCPGSRSEARAPVPRKRQFLFNYRASVIETKRSVLLQRVRSSLRARIRKPGIHMYAQTLETGAIQPSNFCIEYSSLIRFRIVLWCFVKGVFVQTTEWCDCFMYV